ncbi:hypothetical protein CLOM_g22487 [Closterium sp. NIES-68]|nr:hypothetical protein CLOM_g22487 [Closterium sp. NIES-68]GJP78124.1 hypothetical protein CLOP_g8458 [Closterium sp. NIES-67]
MKPPEKFPKVMSSRAVVARIAAAVAVWMACAGVLAGLVAWRVQKGFDDNRKAELDAWCAGRARSLQQQFMLTADHVQVLAGLATVFGGVRRNPWAVGSCMTQRRFVHFVERTIPAQPWVHAVGYMAIINGSDRAAFERQAHCQLLDILGKSAPVADWYMNSRMWFQENPPLPLLEMTSTCVNVRTHPSYGPQLNRMHELGANLLSLPYVLDNGQVGMGMGFPIFKDGVTTSSPLAERQAALIGLIAASIDFNSLAAFIISEVLRQGVEYALEVYDVTSTDTLAFSSTASAVSIDGTSPARRLLYGVGDLPQGDPMQVSKLIPPSNETMLQPHRYKSVQQINVTDTSRSYQMWCRFGGLDTAHSWTAILLATVIVVVAALLAAIGVSVACNTRAVREKTVALEMLKEKTQEAERNKSAFIANTAHELRTPIIGVRGMLEELAEGQVDEGQREDVGTAVGEVERILALINVVLDVSKAEAGRLQLETLPFHLRCWLREALHTHAHAAQARHLDFTCHVDTSVPEVLVGDYLRLQQVVDSIVDNAIKFTSSGGVCVRLQCLPATTDIPAHLRSLGCHVAQHTPAAANAPAAATRAAARGNEGGGAARAPFMEQVEQRGLAAAVMGVWAPRLLQERLASLNAWPLACPLHTGMVTEREWWGGEDGESQVGEEGERLRECEEDEARRECEEGEGASAEQGRSEGLGGEAWGRGEGGDAARQPGEAEGTRGETHGRLALEKSGDREKEGRGNIVLREGGTERALLRHADEGEGDGHGIGGPCVGAREGGACEGGACERGACEGDACGRGACGGGACRGGACGGGACGGGACGGGACSGGACEGGACEGGACEGGACEGGACEGGACGGGACRGGACEGGACERCACGGGGNKGAWMDAARQWLCGPCTEGSVVSEGNADRRLVLLLTCEDTGCGIVEVEQADVFHAFMQPHQKRHDHGGSGMSLHLSRQLVSLLGGSIGLLSTEGHGTTLHVAMPFTAAAAPSPLTAAASSAAAAYAATSFGSDASSGCGPHPSRSWSASEGEHGCGGGESTSGVKVGGERVQSAKEALKEMLQGMAILVVDDNVINRRVAASTLGRYGADVTLAESGEAALLLLQPPHSFRLVLMDLHMPLMDGYQATALLRAMEGGAGRMESISELLEGGAEGLEGGPQRQQRTHVVAMSADVDSAVAARATEAGMDGAVQKPLNEKVLLKVLSTLSAKQRRYRTHSM